MNASPFGRFALRLIDRVMRVPMDEVDGQTRDMISEIVADMPLRSLTSSGVSMRTVEGLVFMLNGRYLHGLARMVSFWLKARRQLRRRRGEGWGVDAGAALRRPGQGCPPWRGRGTVAR